MKTFDFIYSLPINGTEQDCWVSATKHKEEISIENVLFFDVSNVILTEKHYKIIFSELEKRIKNKKMWW